MLRCGREASQIDARQSGGIRRTEDGTDVVRRADVVRDDGDGVGKLVQRVGSESLRV